MRVGVIGHGGLLRVFSFARPIRGSGHVEAIYPQTCPDLGFAVQFNAETRAAIRLWPDRRRLQLPLDDCCRLVLPYHAVQHATDGTDL